jgi:hypothetical protein
MNLFNIIQLVVMLICNQNKISLIKFLKISIYLKLYDSDNEFT